MDNPKIENHPWHPYIPQNAEILMLGTFPPSSEKWSMEFYYPNWINDMWRIMGIIFYNDKDHFCINSEKKFKLDEIKDFLDSKKIGIFDTATQVRRLKGNASDKFLDIVTPLDLFGILENNKSISTIITTGEKAASVIASLTTTPIPAVGKYQSVEINGKELRHYRMPSSSRAYPMSITKKAEIYETFFKFLK